MNMYTYTEARQNLSALLEQALSDGEVLIRRRDGQVFALRPAAKRDSPFDVEGIDLGLSATEIVGFVREGRRAYDVDGDA